MREASDDSGSLVRRYYYEGGINKLAMVDNGANTYVPLIDDRGTLMGAANTSGDVIEKLYYNATGLCRSYDGSDDENLRDGSGPNIGKSEYIPFGWLGMYHDPFTGKYHTHYREYDPVHERWLNEDPAGYTNGLNLYAAYMGVNDADPLGLRIADYFTSEQLEELFANPEGKGLEDVSDDEALWGVTDLLKFKEGRLTLMLYLGTNSLSGRYTMGTEGGNSVIMAFEEANRCSGAFVWGLTASEVRSPFKRKEYLEHAKFKCHELKVMAAQQGLSFIVGTTIVGPAVSAVAKGVVGMFADDALSGGANALRAANPKAVSTMMNSLDDYARNSYPSNVNPRPQKRFSKWNSFKAKNGIVHDPARMRSWVKHTQGQNWSGVSGDKSGFKKWSRLAGKTHGHHVFPQEFADDFLRIGIDNIDDYIFDIPAGRHLGNVHSGRGGGVYNDWWRAFFRQKYGSATPDAAFKWLEIHKINNFLIE